MGAAIICNCKAEQKIHHELLVQRYGQGMIGDSAAALLTIR